jgi:hypothetical protein
LAAAALLDKAPRNALGMVEYETDFFILRPAEPGRASGTLVYDVTNRGRKMIFNLLLSSLPSAGRMPLRFRM